MLVNAHNTQGLLKSQLSFMTLFRAGLDPLVILICLHACVAAFGEQFDGRYLILTLLVFSLTFPGNLSLATSTTILLREIVLGWILLSLILLFFGYATRYLDAFPPELLLSWVLITPVCLFVAHKILPVLLPGILALEGHRRAVIAGTNDLGLKLALQFVNRPFLGVTFLGFFDDRSLVRIGHLDSGPLLGKINELSAFVKEHRVESIYITLPMASQPRILGLLDELRDTTASIHFVPDIFVADLIQARMDNVGGIPVVAVCETPFYGVNGMVKRVSDIVLGTLILLLILPLLILIAIGVKAGSPGPVLFKQRRYGVDGQDIVVYKFRSMTVCEDSTSHIEQAKKNDQRITRFGAFLRKSSLDELPQFFNVLQGRMSIVGPRPHAVAHNEMYRKLIKGYMIRHKVKPGITGWAQVNGYRGETDTLDKMQKRIEFDLDYLRSWSLTLDLYIILKTVFVVIQRENAY